MRLAIIALLATCQILTAGLNTGGSGSGGGGGTGTVTSIDMTVPSGFSVTGVPVTNSGTIVMTLGAVPQTLISLADPGDDRLVGWDDSASSYAFFTAGTNLTITGTTLDATGGGSSQISVDGSIVSNPDFTDGGDINFAAAASTVTGTVGPNSVALTTDTTGSYVTSVATTSPLTGGASASEGATLTLAISGDGIGPTQIDETANYSWTGIHEFDSDAVQIDDIDGSHQLVLTPGSNLTSDRVLTINTGDSARQFTISGDSNINGTATGTNTGDQTITLTGDVTGSGTGSFATTIADNAVDGGDISLGSEAQGNIMYNNGTDWVVLAPSTDGLVLHTHGAGANPTWDSDDGAGGGAPVDATYITQTVNGTLSNEQALSSLSTGMMKVTTTTGVVSSVTDSAGVAGTISDETGTGALTFATAPTFTTNISVGSAGVRLTAGDGSLTWLGLGSGADEDLTVNLNDVANTVTFSSSTGVTAANFSAIGLQESGNAVPNATDTLAFFASTTSAQLAGVLSDESGSGATIFGTAPTFTTSLAIGSAGVRLSDDGDGALTLLGLGNGSDEDLTLNLDDTPNEVTITSSTGLATANFSAIGLAESGNAVPNSSDNLGFFASTTSAQLAGVLTNETGTGAVVFGTAPTFTTSITTPILISAAADPADAGAVRLGNAELIEWEASPTGTDVTLTVDTSEVMQASGTFNASTLTEGGTAVPNTGDNLSVFASTTSAQLAGIISNETGSGSAVFGTTPTIATPVITGAVSWEDGTRQTFNPDATNAGLNVGSQAGDPSSLSNGDIWYNSSANSLYGRIGGTTVALGAGTGDVTAASSFGTDNVLIKSDGTGKGVQSTGISVDDSNNITGITTFTSTTVSAGTLEFEGTTADANETSIAVEDPTSDRTFTIRNATGTALISGDTLTGDVAATFDTDGSSAATIQANSVALSTDTTGNYAAGDAEAGAALTGDSATAFFTSGQIERARGGTGTDTSVYGAGLLGSDGSNNTIDVDTTSELGTALGMTATSALQTRIGSSTPYIWSTGTVYAFAAESTATSSSTSGAFIAMWENDGVAMASGDRLGGFLFGGSSSASNVRNSAEIFAYASQTWTDGAAYGTRLTFNVVANGATTTTERLAVEQSGLISFGGSTASFPAIKRNSAAINFRLADDSADAAITAAGATFSGAITESANAVPNATDNLGFFSATSSAQFAGVINDETGTGSVVLATGPTFANASIGNGGTSAGVLTLLEDTDAGSNFASFQVPSLAANTVYVLPADDGDSGEQLTTDGSGNLTWESAGGGGGGGDIDAVGDVASGAAFNGTAGTILTFNDADGDLTFGTNATANTMELSAPLDLGSAGVRLSGDGDGAITLLGLGNGSDEDLTINLDDTSNTATITSSTGLATANFSGIALQESGSAVPNATDNLSFFAATSSAQLITLVSDETGTGSLVFGTSPTLTTPRVADLGYIADVNGNELLMFDSSTSAINNFQISNTPTATVPTLSVVGDDANIDMNFQVKGNGFYRFNATTSVAGSLILKEITTNGTEEVLLVAPSALASSPVVTLPSTTGTLVVSGGDIGAATATTAAANTNTTQVATTAYVQSELTAYASDTVTFTNKTLTAPIISSISNTGTVTLPTSTDTLVGKATTDILTNKTLDGAGTGNVLKFKSLPQFTSPLRVQGTNATIGTTVTDVGYGLVTYSNSVDEASNWAEWRILVPADFDTAVDPRIKIADLIGSDTSARQYTVSVASVASSASGTAPTLGTAIDVNMAGDGSGVANDIEISSTTTLTGWGAALTPGQLMVIRVARDGDQGTQDASTVNSTLVCFELEYGATQ